jgi:hypothetical protein
VILFVLTSRNTSVTTQNRLVADLDAPILARLPIPFNAARRLRSKLATS